MNHYLRSPISLIERMMSRFRSIEINYDEAKVPVYSLPDPLRLANGSKITKPAEWNENRRPEILRLFQNHVYGYSPKADELEEFHQISYEASVLQDLAVRKEVTILFEGQAEDFAIHVLLYIPNQAPKPVPAFLGLNFNGNHTIHPESGISLHKQWQKLGRNFTPRQILPSEETRGLDRRRWPVEKILKRGYAIATAYYGDLEPDFPGGWRYGIRSALRVRPEALKSAAEGFQSTVITAADCRGAPPWASPNEWGAIGAWAWGISRIMDYLERDSDILPTKIILLGHSRLGKTALWAGAQDDRFAIVISNNSGCGGAALSRRCFGETVKLMNLFNPHWFCGNFKNYNDKEGELPVDQHMLIGLIAPRPLYVASASEDRGADPRGEFLSAWHADPIYALFGLTGLGVEQMPGLNEPVGETIGYHIRAGKHEMTDYDWNQFLCFADRHFGSNSPCHRSG